MRRKTGKYMSIVTIVILIFIIFMLFYNYFGQGRNEIEVANNFIKKMQSEDIIKKTSGEIKFDVKEKTGTENEEGIYSLVSKDYRIDLDKNKNIVSFVHNTKNGNKINISPDKAKELAELYVKELCEGDYKVEGINKEEKNPYYSIVFSKYEDGYPYYSEKLLININKETGKLQGYMNKTATLNHKRVDINISKEEAENSAIDIFNKLYSNGKIDSDTYLAYYNKDTENKSELCYIINISNKKESYMYFVSAHNGDVINSISNIIEETKVK
ncbi:MAG: PepSY domain-containing protein [Clostridium sp.]|uniref:PepSY domain-containing protein n=1 Tax=Clostridium sp. TaxID=1506 RepID=UPI003F2F6871